MAAYALRRLLLLTPTVVLVAFLSFMLIRLVPGDVIVAQMGAGGDVGGLQNVDPRAVERLRHDLGLYGSVPEQFARWVRDAVQGDFGKSWLTHKSTLEEFRRRLPVTVQLGLMAIAWSAALGVSVGVVSALYQDKPLDYLGRVSAVLALSIPNFFLGVLMIILFSRVLHYAFPTGVNQIWVDPVANMRQFIVPSFVLAASSAGVTARLTRTAVLEVLRQDYIRTAHAKGLAEHEVILKHTLKNALIPVVTLVGAQLTFIIGGSVVVEQIFNLRGVGQLTLTSLLQRDYIQLQTNVFIFSVILVLGNLITDLSYGWLDPRVRYS